MKIFFVFLGLMIANVTFLFYQSDFSRYLELQTMLKALAEECAAGAALYYEEEEYSRGFFVIQDIEAVQFVEAQISQAEGLLSQGEGKSLSYVIDISDDRSTDLNRENSSPSVTVTIRLDTEDIFRLSFLKVDHIIRSSKYELADYPERW